MARRPRKTKKEALEGWATIERWIRIALYKWPIWKKLILCLLICFGLLVSYTVATFDPKMREKFNSPPVSI